MSGIQLAAFDKRTTLRPFSRFTLSVRVATVCHPPEFTLTVLTFFPLTLTVMFRVSPQM